MATLSANTAAPNRAPFIPAPPAAISRVLSRFDRGELSSFIAVAIDLLDFADGDNDVEANGDELDANLSEDDFMHHYGNGPGCVIADPDASADDEGECEDGI